MILPLSSRGRGPLPFTEETGIRIPPGVFLSGSIMNYIIEPEKLIYKAIKYFN